MIYDHIKVTASTTAMWPSMNCRDTFVKLLPSSQLSLLACNYRQKLDKVNSANLLFEFWSLFFLLSSVKEIKDCNNCGKYSIVHSKDRPLCKWPFVKERRNKFCEEQLSRGTIVTWNNCPECVARDIEGHWYMMVLGQYRVVLAGIWWYWVSMGQYWLLLGDIGSV